jgi:hypothetical protein
MPNANWARREVPLYSEKFGMHSLCIYADSVALPSPLVGEGWLGGRLGPVLGYERHHCEPNVSTPPNSVLPHKVGGDRCAAPACVRHLFGALKAPGQEPSKPVHSPTREHR